MDDLRRFVGPENTSGQLQSNNLGMYYRGGSYIPNITQNSAIPTSGQIALSNFYGFYTQISIANIVTKFGIGQSTSSGGSASAQWIANTDFTVGYGPSMASIVEYRYTHDTTYQRKSGATGFNLTFTAGGAAYNVTSTDPFTSPWRTGYGNVSIAMSITNFREVENWGNITIEIRHRDYTSVTQSATGSYQLLIYGP